MGKIGLVCGLGHPSPTFAGRPGTDKPWAFGGSWNPVAEEQILSLRQEQQSIFLGLYRRPPGRVFPQIRSRRLPIQALGKYNEPW
jgi:hypothetical protein